MTLGMEEMREGGGGPKARDLVIRGGALLAGAVLMGVAAWWVYRLEVVDEKWRMACLVTWMVCGALGAGCLAFAMGCVNGLMGKVRGVGARAGLVVLQRVMLVGQLGLMGVALLGAGLWGFGVAVPGPDREVLKQGWVPPAAVEPGGR